MRRLIQLVFLFILVCSQAYGQVDIAAQDFDGVDTWTYTPSPTPYNVSGDVWDVVPSLANIVLTNQFFGCQDLNNPNGGGAFLHTLTFAAVDVSSYMGATASFDYDVDGYDAGDNVFYEFAIDGISQGLVTLIAGVNNGGTSGNGTITINIPDGSSNVSLVISVEQNGTDQAGFDNAIVRGTLSAGTPGITLTPITGNTSEDATTQTFTVVLNSMPASDVVVDVTSGDLTENTVDLSMLTFTTGDWDQPQTVTVTGVDDADFDGDQTTAISIATNNGMTSDVNYQGLSEMLDVINEDNEVILTCLDDISCAFEIVPVALNSEGDNWTCSAGTYTVNGFVSGSDGTDNTDVWLIYGSLDIASATVLDLTFDLTEDFDGSDLVFAYTDSYTGCPGDAGNNWTTLSTLSSGGAGLSVDLSGITSTDVYLGIQYVGDGQGGLTSGYTLSNVKLEGDVCPTVNTPIVSSCAIPTEVQFSEPTSDINEDEGTITVCVNILNESATVATTVDIALDVTSTTTNGDDYTMISFPSTLTFPAGGATAQCQTIVITDDIIEEGAETIILNLENPTGGTMVSLGAQTQHVITISANDVPIPTADNIRINELDSDTNLTNDAGEFIELYSPDGSITALDNLVLVLFNAGTGGTGIVSYQAYDLDGETLDGNGFWLIGATGGSFTPDVVIPGNTIQNGADAVALYQGSASDWPNGTSATIANLIDALVYDTNDADATNLMNALGVTEQIDENENGQKDFQSIQRGSWFVDAPTPRAMNVNLPVKWLSFEVVAEEKSNEVLWTTASEINNERFEVERSDNGRDYILIGSVAGFGNTYSETSYSFTDSDVSNGTSYYRLKQMDTDGQFEYSAVATATRAAARVSIYPTSTADMITVEMDDYVGSRVEVYSQAGQLVERIVLTQELTTIDLSSQVASTYIVRVISDSAETTQRIIKL